MERLTRAEAEQELYNIYQWYAREAPGVQVQEVGHVADLWAIVDSLSAENA